LQRGPGPRAHRTCAATTDARPTTRRAAHHDSRECCGRVPTRSLSWVARTSAAKPVRRVQQSIACSAAQNHKQARRCARWRRTAVATGCDRCNMQHGLLRAGSSVAAQTSKQKHARTRAHALPHAHLQSTTHTRANSTRTVKHKHTDAREFTHIHTHSHGTYTLSHSRHTHTYQHTQAHTHTLRTHTRDTHTHYTLTRTHNRREREAQPHACVRGVRAEVPRSSCHARHSPRRAAGRAKARARRARLTRIAALDAHRRARCIERALRVRSDRWSALRALALAWTREG
jgi:hypothetical protein